MNKDFRLGAGIGNKCSGGWTSNKQESRLSRLEKLRLLAYPNLNVTWQQTQLEEIENAESVI